MNDTEDTMPVAGRAATGPRLISAGATDVGAVRRINEDAWLSRPEIGLWAVADGMGGHAAGDVASRAVMDALRLVPSPSNAAALLRSVRAAIERANQTLRGEAARRGQGGVIGATVVAFMVREAHFALVWAGDSRAYLLRQGRLTQISRDHSHVQDLVDAGVIKAEQAERHPMANVVTRAVGAGDDLALDQVIGEVLPGDLYLLCTDGLTRMVPDDGVAAILRHIPLERQPAALIARAMAAGGADNVTAVVIGVGDPP